MSWKRFCMMSNGQTLVCPQAMTRLTMSAKDLTNTSRRQTRLQQKRMKRLRNISKRSRMPRKRWTLILAPVSGAHGQTGQSALKHVRQDHVTERGRLRRKLSIMELNVMGRNLRRKFAMMSAVVSSSTVYYSFQSLRLLYEGHSVSVGKFALTIPHHEAPLSSYCCLELQQLLCFSCWLQMGSMGAMGWLSSGCDQEKTRIRQMVVEASCNGMECEGNDYEKKICSREEELADQVRALLDENENLEKNQCPSDNRKT